jgi:hypothetical protein
MNWVSLDLSAHMCEKHMAKEGKDEMSRAEEEALIQLPRPHWTYRKCRGLGTAISSAHRFSSADIWGIMFGLPGVKVSVTS